MSDDTQKHVYVVFLESPEEWVEMGIWTAEQDAQAQAVSLRALVAESGLHSRERIGVVERPINRPTQENIRFVAFDWDPASGRFTWSGRELTWDEDLDD